MYFKDLMSFVQTSAEKIKTQKPYSLKIIDPETLQLKNHRPKIQITWDP